MYTFYLGVAGESDGKRTGISAWRGRGRNQGYGGVIGGFIPVAAGSAGPG